MPRTSLLIASVLVLCASRAIAAEPASALIKLPSGITLHYAVQGRSDGEPIVLLHGIGDSWHSYELVLPHLPERFRVYAVTMRGHGWSDAPQAGYAQRDFAADIVAFLDALDLRRVTLVGHSLGSFIAQATAVRDVSRIARLVLIGSGPGGVRNEDTRKEAVQLFKSIKAPMEAGFARDFQSSTVSGAVPAAYLEKMFEQAMRAAPQMWQQTEVFDAATAAGLAKLTTPVLLLWGDKDSMLQRADQDALLKVIPKARLIVYEGAGHAPHWEQPERVARDIVAFTQP